LAVLRVVGTGAAGFGGSATRVGAALDATFVLFGRGITDRARYWQLWKKRGYAIEGVLRAAGVAGLMLRKIASEAGNAMVVVMMMRRAWAGALLHCLDSHRSTFETWPVRKLILTLVACT
jgi:hypothetical protein